jgi:hypothetical protein
MDQLIVAVNQALEALDESLQMLLPKAQSDKCRRAGFALRAALEQPERKNWQHAANEWADMATNGIQWVRNISLGISTPEEALKNLEACLAHCREVNDGPVDEESKP